MWDESCNAIFFILGIAGIIFMANAVLKAITEEHPFSTQCECCKKPLIFTKQIHRDSITKKIYCKKCFDRVVQENEVSSLAQRIYTLEIDAFNTERLVKSLVQRINKLDGTDQIRTE